VAKRRLKILTLTTLFPSAARPRHGIFVENRLLHLQKYGDAEARIVAPVPWFPSKAERFGRYASFARTPRQELRAGNIVYHPRYAALPAIGSYVQPFSLALAFFRQIRLLQRSGFEGDIVDAHYLYPDGVAAALVARCIAKPLVITARGSDINLFPDFAWPRRLILWATRQADAIVTVSAALKQSLVKLGVDPARITVLRNGVDLDLFRPATRQEARARIGLAEGPLIASIGNLVPEKGHDLAIGALALLPGTHLMILGSGPQRVQLQELAHRIGVADRVHFLAERPQSELKWVYSAADVLVLASSREGWPNVLLESMACGTPVVAANVGGVREIVTEPCAGRIVDERSAEAFAKAIRDIADATPQPVLVRRFAEGFDWSATSQGQLDVFARAQADFAGRTGAVA
jgi:teichuronic acid biosynthesis glycosyltransferase TuaC